MFHFYLIWNLLCVTLGEDLGNDTTKAVTERHVFPTSYQESVYYGKLSLNCVDNYHRVLVRKKVPSRLYKYFHETVEDKLADNELQWRIVGGNQVDIRNAPYAVLYGAYCGGTIIAPEWVITAAHCKTWDDFVTAGSSKSSEGHHYPICSHFLHPKWNLTHKLHSHDYDYQLLLLEYQIPVTAWSTPIAIGKVDDIKSGVMITLSGWGHTATKQKKMQSTIRQVSVPIIPHETCQALPHRYYKTITPRMFCAGYLRSGSKDSCQGDSGGPAIIKNKLVGLISFGVGCAEPDRPGVYTDIPLARAWIRQVTGLPL